MNDENISGQTMKQENRSWWRDVTSYASLRIASGKVEK